MPAQHDKKMKQITEQEAFFKLSAMCAAAEHCRHEMSEKMARWQLPDDVQERIMQRLVDESISTRSATAASSCATRYDTTNGDAERWNKR